MNLTIDPNKCHASCECIKVCPQGAIRIVNGKAHIDESKCDLDGICIPACPHDAIQFEE
ncbi:MAG: ferredoxin [Desulfuromonas sp.]|nr:MAG: ferredoxin [Desulfuromonas sp.]